MVWNTPPLLFWNWIEPVAERLHVSPVVHVRLADAGAATAAQSARAMRSDVRARMVPHNIQNAQEKPNAEHRSAPLGRIRCRKASGAGKRPVEAE
jgi:hypothetical protein